MKALTHLDAVKQLVSLFDKGGMTNEEFQVKLAKLNDFYSQPFKPEMITELFEGWDVKKVESHFRAMNAPEIWSCYLNIERNVSYWWLLLRNESLSEFPMGIMEMFQTRFTQTKVLSKLPKPKTLDHFISDCQRAGIELTFKKEVVEKYFSA